MPSKGGMEMEEKLRKSYASASEFPTKLVHISVTDKERNIKPIHVNFYPTNKCNLKCKFCSCADRDKSMI